MKKLFTKLNMAVVVLTAIALPVLSTASAAAAYNPAPWANLLLPAPIGYIPATSNVCLDGNISCVDATISALQSQLASELTTCSHRSAFTLTYLRIEDAYKATALTPGYYQNTPAVNQFDQVFASYYFNQKDAWSHNNQSGVSDAWKIAFDAADNKKTTALGDLFLAVNAHIVNDEASALDQVGLVYPDGTTAKNDYNKDNEWLFAAQDPTIAEIARRLDPSITQPVNINMPPTDSLSYQLIALWREQAWRFTEQMKAAESLPPILGQPAYNLVRAEINTEAVANANLIKAATAVTNQQQVTDRDNYCMAHRYDP